MAGGGRAKTHSMTQGTFAVWWILSFVVVFEFILISNWKIIVFLEDY